MYEGYLHPFLILNPLFNKKITSIIGPSWASSSILQVFLRVRRHACTHLFGVRDDVCKRKE